jgi:hypothetical protein
VPIQILQEVPTAATIILDDIIHTFEGFLAKNQEASFDRTTFFFSVSASGIVFCIKRSRRGSFLTRTCPAKRVNDRDFFKQCYKTRIVAGAKLSFSGLGMLTLIILIW